MMTPPFSISAKPLFTVIVAEVEGVSALPLAELSLIARSVPTALDGSEAGASDRWPPGPRYNSLSSARRRAIVTWAALLTWNSSGAAIHRWETAGSPSEPAGPISAISSRAEIRPGG